MQRRRICEWRPDSRTATDQHALRLDSKPACFAYENCMIRPGAIVFPADGFLQSPRLDPEVCSCRPAFNVLLVTCPVDPDSIH